MSDLRIGDLEACFAGSVCASLVADQRGMRAFDLPRMHRLVSKFRALIADACYGTVLADDCSSAEVDAVLSPGASLVIIRVIILAMSHSSDL